MTIDSAPSVAAVAHVPPTLDRVNVLQLWLACSILPCIQWHVLMVFIPPPLLASIMYVDMCRAHSLPHVHNFILILIDHVIWLSHPLACMSAIVAWSLSARLRNRMAHIVNGNGRSTGAKGRGKNKLPPSSEGATSKASAPAPPSLPPPVESHFDDFDFQQAVQASLPEAARLRMQPILQQEEWSHENSPSPSPWP